MPTDVMLLVNAAAGIVLVGAAVAPRIERFASSAAVGLAVLPLVSATTLVVYVFGEDSYRDNGISRWHAYRSPGGALGPLFVLFVVLAAVCSAALAYAAVRRRGRLLRVAALTGGLACLVLGTTTIVGFTAN